MRASDLSGVMEKVAFTPMSSPLAVRALRAALVVALAAVLRSVTVRFRPLTSLVKGVGVVSSLKRMRPSRMRTSGAFRSSVLTGAAVALTGSAGDAGLAATVALPGMTVEFAPPGDAAAVVALSPSAGLSGASAVESFPADGAAASAFVALAAPGSGPK